MSVADLANDTAVVVSAGELRDLVSRLQSPWLTVSAAAAHTGLSRSAIRALVDTGKLTGYPLLRGKLLVSREELDSVIRASARKKRGRKIG